jgi:hypothetical protein
MAIAGNCKRYATRLRMAPPYRNHFPLRCTQTARILLVLYGPIADVKEHSSVPLHGMAMHPETPDPIMGTADRCFSVFGALHSQSLLRGVRPLRERGTPVGAHTIAGNK